MFSTNFLFKKPYTEDGAAQRNVNIGQEKRLNYTETLFVNKVCNYEKKHARDKNYLYVIKLSLIDKQMYKAE